MIDLHTHILPGWDDGSQSWDETDKMIDIARRDGIQKIALAPHVYNLNKHKGDISGLKEKIAEFKIRNIMFLKESKRPRNLGLIPPPPIKKVLGDFSRS